MPYRASGRRLSRGSRYFLVERAFMKAPFEQRNPYKGNPERPWITVRLAGPDGSIAELELLADTGNPCAIIISQQQMLRLKVADAPDVSTNFGLLQGGWLQLTMPEFGLGQPILGYASDAVAAVASADHTDLQGLAGLPLLRLVEYGGDASSFWLRAVSSQV